MVSTYGNFQPSGQRPNNDGTSLAIGITLAILGVTDITKTAVLTPAAAAKAEDDFQLVKVADGVYAATARPGGLASGNAGFVVGDGGVLIVDTFLTPTAIQELIGEIRAQTPLPIRFAVNTHYHLDHTGGNQVLAALGVPIIAHDNVAVWQTTEPALPAGARRTAEKKGGDGEKTRSDTG